MNITMNDRPLGTNELTLFSISHFSCHAFCTEKTVGAARVGYVEVEVYVADSAHPLMIRHLPADTTLREIKRRAAYFILQEIEGMRFAASAYHSMHKPVD